MISAERFRDECAGACGKRGVPETHREAIVTNVLADPRTTEGLKLTSEDDAAVFAETAVIREAIYYFAKGAGRSDQNAVSEFRKKTNSILWQNLLTRESNARSGRRVTTPSYAEHPRMAFTRSRGIHRMGKSSPSDRS